MAEKPTVHIGENSPEHVAFKLLEMIANVEGRSFSVHEANPADRDWILQTYAEALVVVRSPVGRART